MNQWGKIVSSVSVVVLLLAGLAAAAPGRTETQGYYLVGLKAGAAARGLAMAGLTVDAEFPEVRAVAVRANAAALRALQNHRDVEYVEGDEVRTTLGALADGTYTWGLQAVHAPEARALGANGAAIKVCVLDTGIDESHPEFYREGSSIVKGKKDFTRSRSGTFDQVGHGTHVAGTIAGQLNAGGSLIGVAPGVDLYVAKVLGDNGTGRSSWIMNGVKWCVETAKANVLSMSLGGGRPSRTEERSYSTYYAKGALIIAAAGNDGDGTTFYPAGYRDVLSVAALDSNLNRAAFSQYNADVELAGPGVATLSSVPLGTGRMAAASEDGLAYQANGVEYSPAGDVSGPLVECGLADSASSCQGAPGAGAWVALISRGSINFADKVRNVMAQGAAAAIITNNDTVSPDDAGSFTLGSADNWIPTVSVSYNSGVAVRSGGLGAGRAALNAWDYAYLQGTSMATPHVSGVAALAWSADPSLSNASIRSILQGTALDLGAAGRDAEYGFGLVQADAAANRARGN